jgi:superfamily II DNA/RNA helicase
VEQISTDRQTLLFSATLDGEVGELARSYTFNPSRYDAELPSHLELGETEHKFVPVTAENKVEHTVASSHKSEQFATDYGVLIKELRFLQRAVFVVGGNGSNQSSAAVDIALCVAGRTTRSRGTSLSPSL